MLHKGQRYKRYTTFGIAYRHPCTFFYNRSLPFMQSLVRKQKTDKDRLLLATQTALSYITHLMYYLKRREEKASAYESARKPSFCCISFLSDSLALNVCQNITLCYKTATPQLPRTLNPCKNACILSSRYFSVPGSTSPGRR